MLSLDLGAQSCARRRPESQSKLSRGVPAAAGLALGCAAMRDLLHGLVPVDMMRTHLQTLSS